MIEPSVIIPTYDRAGRLQATLAALSRQTASPDSFEVVVVVDGSTDETLAVLGQMAPPYRLAPIWLCKGRGYAKCWNMWSPEAAALLASRCVGVMALVRHVLDFA